MNDALAEVETTMSVLLGVPQAAKRVAYVGPVELKALQGIAARSGAASPTDFYGLPVVLVPDMTGVVLMPRPEVLWPRDYQYVQPKPQLVPFRVRLAAALLAVPLVAWATLLVFGVLQVAARIIEGLLS